jgi:hypothetical protein
MCPRACDKPDIFIAGLPIEITPGELRKMLKRITTEPSYLQIVRCKRGVLMPRAIAFIRLAPCADAVAVIEKLHGVVMDGHTITVTKFKAVSNRAPRACFHSVPHPWTIAQTEAAQ